MSIRSFVFALICAAATLLSLEQALAATGADPASVIATRTAPGETTSQSCGPNGFVVVTFLAGGAVVSTIESGTACTPGSGGSNSLSSLSPQLEQDLRNLRLSVLLENLALFIFDVAHSSIISDDPRERLREETDKYLSDPTLTSEETAALLSQYKQDLANAQSQEEVSRIEGLIETLEQQNQTAGPSGDTFEALRTRGIEFWSHGGIAFTDDTQSGRNLEIEQQEITVGVQGRFSERLLLGLAASYVNGDNEDQTGAGISTDTDTFLLAPYFAYQLSEDLVLDASGVYGFTDVSLTRAATATASSGATSIGGQIGLSLRHKLSQVISFTGRVGQSYVTTDSDGYTDTGGVTVTSSDSEQAATSLSGRVNISTDPDWRWHGGLRVRYDTIDPGNGVDRLYGTLSTGLEYNPGAYAVSVQANRSVFRSNYEATGFSLQVRVPF